MNFFELIDLFFRTNENRFPFSAYSMTRNTLFLDLLDNIEIIEESDYVGMKQSPVDIDLTLNGFEFLLEICSGIDFDLISEPF